MHREQRSSQKLVPCCWVCGRHLVLHHRVVARAMDQFSMAQDDASLAIGSGKREVAVEGRIVAIATCALNQSSGCGGGRVQRGVKHSAKTLFGRWYHHPSHRILKLLQEALVRWIPMSLTHQGVPGELHVVMINPRSLQTSQSCPTIPPMDVPKTYAQSVQVHVESVLLWAGALTCRGVVRLTRLLAPWSIV